MAAISKEKLCLLRLVVDKDSSHKAFGALESMGISYVHAEPGRNVLLGEATSLSLIFSTRRPMVDTQSLVLSFCVPSDAALPVVEGLTSLLGLDQPGKGSITGRFMDRLGAYTGFEIAQPVIPPHQPKIVARDLMGITCIVQKGEGGKVASIGLATGTGMPDLGYGLGTGLRNRLGPWRILVPAEKELVHLVVHRDDAHTVLEMMIAAGSLDQPGKGFIYSYPLAYGVLETKLSAKEGGQVASLEQIVAAVDELKGGTEWRRKNLSFEPEKSGGHDYLESLIDLSFSCNEGLCEGLTKAAMEAGAGGATMRKLSYLKPGVQESQWTSAISKARELSIMTIGPGQLEAVTQALLDSGLLGHEAAGELFISPVDKAFTYIKKHSR